MTAEQNSVDELNALFSTEPVYVGTNVKDENPSEGLE
jgi:hypothetical protein